MSKLKKILAGALALIMCATMAAAPVMADDGEASTELTFEQMVEQNRALSRRVATEGMVLLENKMQSLPLKEGEKVAIFGKAQIDFLKGGSGSGNVYVEHVVGLLEGLELNGKVDINQTLANKYKANSSYNPSEAEVKTAAVESDTAIIILSRNSTEGGDRNLSEYYLTTQEETLISNVCKAGFDNISVVLNIGGIIDVSWIEKYPAIKSVLLAWQPGMEGGHAVADILTGIVTPSGKLTDTFATDYYDYSTSDDYNTNQYFINYQEDIYIGYRYFETFAPEKVVYEFGYGMSYTSFRMSGVKVTNDDENIYVNLNVKNTGSEYSGKEVVQVYFSAPQGELGKPAKELAAYAKTDLLAPGETQELTISFPIADMSSYDDLGKHQKSAYILENGEYNIYVGNSVRDADKKGVRGTYTVDEKDGFRLVEQLTEQARPETLDTRWVNDDGKIGTEELNTSDKLEDAYFGFPVDPTKITKIEGEDVYQDSQYFEVTSGLNGTALGLEQMGEGAWAVFDFDIQEAGQYEITLHMGCNNATTTVNTVVYDAKYDKQLQNVGTVTLPNTGGKWTLTDFTLPAINFAKGTQYVRFNFSQSNFGTIDYLTIKKVGSNATETVALVRGKVYTPEETEVNYTPVIPASGVILLQDVKDGNATMQEFLAQLSNEQLADLLRGKGTTLSYANTGCIGNLREFGIPAAETADGPAGVRFNQGDINSGNMSISTTAWPVGTCLASTWNEELIEEMAKAFGYEAAYYDIDILLAPGMNIHYNPLCGRNFEYYSEDPLVTGKTGAAMARGVQTQGVSITLKHFTSNHREREREYVDSRMSERALREIYLKGFEIAVKEGDPWSIMASYNRVNGVEPSESYSILTSILRDEWGYDGIVMTDWNNDTFAFKEILAGNDCKMVNNEVSQVMAALNVGRITRDHLKTSATRVLEMIMKTNAMDKLTDITQNVAAKGVTRIESENYSSKHSDIGFEACTDEGGGQNTTNGFNGRSIAFRVNLEEGGVYKITTRVAYQGATVFQCNFSNDGNTVGNIYATINSNGYQDWKSAETKITLPAGLSTLSVDFLSNINLNWIELEKVDADTVEVTYDETQIKPGNTVKLEASAAVVWGVKNATSAATKIDANGNLTIGEDETGVLMVYATSAASPDTSIALKLAMYKEPEVAVIKGDLTNDGKVTVSDILALKTIIMSGETPTAEQLAVADLNATPDGKLTVSDILGIKAIIMG